MNQLMHKLVLCLHLYVQYLLPSLFPASPLVQLEELTCLRFCLERFCPSGEVQAGLVGFSLLIHIAATSAHKGKVCLLEHSSLCDCNTTDFSKAR